MVISRLQTLKLCWVVPPSTGGRVTSCRLYGPAAWVHSTTLATRPHRSLTCVHERPPYPTAKPPEIPRCRGCIGRAVSRHRSVGSASRWAAFPDGCAAKSGHGPSPVSQSQTERQRIRAALLRIDEGEYGFCTDCGDQITEKRLAADLATPLCLDCMRGA